MNDRILSLLFTFLFIAVSVGAQVPRNDDYSPAFSPDGQKIVFHSKRYGYSDIFSMNKDGSNQIRLTASAFNDEFPKWSLDGQKIIYQSNREGYSQIFVMNPDGSGQENIISSDSLLMHSTWHPDGKHIIFSSKESGILQVWQADIDGNNIEQLTFSDGNKSYPQVSPNGRLLAYVSDIEGHNELYTTPVAGGKEKKVTSIGQKPARFLNGYSWTPNNQLIFASNIDTQGLYYFSEDIYKVNSDGTTTEKLISSKAFFRNPTISLDGKFIAFESFSLGGSDIHTIAINGLDFTNVSATSSSNQYPNWVSNGEAIVFQSERDGNREIYIMNPDGSLPTNLTNNPSDDRSPSVSPDGTMIAFVSFRESDWGAIYTMDINGNKLMRVTNLNFFKELDQFCIHTSFSQDGKSIIFESAPVLTTKDNGWNIWSIGIDGSRPKKLTNTPGNQRSSKPEVSPDGKTIVYYSNESGNYEIYTMKLDGSDKRNLTNNSGFDYNPSWSADGKSIYFTSRRVNNKPEIFSMQLDGSEVEQITNGGLAGPPSNWATKAPSGDKILITSGENGSVEIYLIDSSVNKTRKQLTGKLSLK